MNAIWCEIYIYTLTTSYKYYKKGALVWLQEMAHILACTLQDICQKNK